MQNYHGEAWAVVDNRGRILVRTVSDTRRSAIINYLCTEAGMLATKFANDTQIEQAWEAKRGHADVMPVAINTLTQ